MKKKVTKRPKKKGYSTKKPKTKISKSFKKAY